MTIASKRYRYESGHLYKLTVNGDSYIHCFKCPSHWSKAKAIKAYERAGAEAN